MKTILAFSSCLLLSACALTAPRFSPGDTDAKQFARDDYECERDARSIQGTDCTQIDMYEKCMRSKGYKADPGTGNKVGCM